MIINGWLALRLFLDAISLYRSEGFNVSEAPPDSGVDLIARSDGRVILIQIKDRVSGQGGTTLSEDVERLGLLMGTYDARLDVLWQPVTRLVPADVVKKHITAARQVASTSTEAALLLGFAALEASVLRMASTLDHMPNRFEITNLAVRLRDDGFISDERLTAMDRLSAIRNQVANGVFNDVQIEPADVDEVVLLATNLLSTTASQAAGLLDQAAQSLSGTRLDNLSASLLALIEHTSTHAPRDVINSARDVLLAVVRR